MSQRISFENTAIAFAHKSNSALKEAAFLFGIMGKPWLVQLGSRLTPWGIKAGLPVKGLIRNTIFKQFVGGETLEETAGVAQKLAQSKVQVILDYGVEGKEGEAEFEKGCAGFIRVINYAATQPNIPYISIKVTGFARFSLLEKLDEAMHRAGNDALVLRYHTALAALTQTEKDEWVRVAARMQKICAAAAAKGIGVLVDAEETWIQDPVDALTMSSMDEWNKQKPVVYNTVQLYRHDRLEFLRKCLQAADERRFILGVKIVRGAYMEKERSRAHEKGYESPIQPSKEASDRDYNDAIQLCLDRLDRIAVIIASHNDGSNLWAVEIMQQQNIPLNHPHVHFSQLYGMSDNITYNLAAAGCNVSKYLPFGPIADVIPYLMRRAQENTSVSGQTGRELSLIKKELARRKLQ